MLRARGSFVVGSSKLAIDVAVSLGVVSVAIERDRLRYDTRFVDASAPVLRDGLVIYIVLEGRLGFGDDAEVEGPVAFALSSGEFEAATLGAVRYSVDGTRVRALELWLESHPHRDRAPTPFTGVVLEAAEALFARAAPGLESASDDDARVAATNALLAALADAGWCDRRMLLQLEGPAWDRLRATFKQLDLRRSLKLLADEAAVSERQFNRDFTALVDLAGTGFRETLRRWRLRLGVLLLSAPDASITEVSRALGYAHPEAMTAIFREAGLPPPSEVRAALLGERSPGSRRSRPPG